MTKKKFFRTSDGSGKLYLHWIFFPCFLIYLDILLPLFTSTPNKAIPTTLLLDIAAGLVFSTVTSIFTRKVNRILSLIIMWLIGFYFVVQEILHGQFSMYVDIRTILQGTGNVVEGYGGMVMKATIGALPVMAIVALPCILYTIFGNKLLSAARPSRWWTGILAEGALLIFVAALFVISQGANRNVYSRAYKFDSAVQVFGLPTATRLEIEYKLFGNHASEGFSGGGDISAETETEAPADENLPENAEDPAWEKNEMAVDLSAGYDDDVINAMNSFVASRRASAKNEYTGLFEGKNLILICAEAFSDAVIDPELTPTLYRLSHNGFYFSDYYQPFWGGSTSTGEYSFLTGLAPQYSLDTIQESIGDNNYFTLGNQLQKKGYYSLAFHNGEYDYFNRHLTHQNMGYSQFIAYGSGLEDILPDDAGDAQMFDVTMDLYIDHQPFSIYYMTISGHYPYVQDSKYTEKYYARVNEALGDGYEETTKYFFCYQMELEEALTVMVQRLEEAGIADDTVICMTADHYPYGLGLEDSFGTTFGNDVDYIQDLYKGSDETLWDRDRNGLIIWSGCLEHGDKDMAVEISAPAFSLDVVPTLSNLFGIEFDSRMLNGRDVFSHKPALVFWNEGSWITSKGKYDILTDTFYPAPGEIRDDEYIEKIINIVADNKYFSGQVVLSDYYGVLFGPDEVTP